MHVTGYDDRIQVDTTQGITAPSWTTYKEPIKMVHEHTIFNVHKVNWPVSQKSVSGEACVNDASSVFSCALHKLKATTSSEVDLPKHEEAFLQ